MGEQFFARLQETTNSNHRFSPNQEPKLRAIYYSFSLQLYQSSMPPQLPHFTTEKHSGYIQGQLFDTDSIIAQFNKQKIQYSQMFDQSVIFFDFCSFLADRGHSWWGFMCSSETILDFFSLCHSGPNIGSLIPSIALPLLILSKHTLQQLERICIDDFEWIKCGENVTLANILAHLLHNSTSYSALQAKKPSSWVHTWAYIIAQMYTK